MEKPTPNSTESPDQITSRINNLFFQPPINPKLKYQKIFEVFIFMICGFFITMLIKIRYWVIIDFETPFLLLLYLSIFIIQINIIKIKHSESMILIYTSGLVFIIKSIMDIIYVKYQIIQTESILYTNVSYILLAFTSGYIYILFLRYRFNSLFNYILLSYRIILLFAYEMYVNHYFLYPESQYLFILGYIILIEGFYYLMLYKLYQLKK